MIKKLVVPQFVIKENNLLVEIVLKSLRCQFRCQEKKTLHHLVCMVWFGMVCIVK